jgi:hypothetical protein
MDADIAAAVTALDLDKIKAQDYRNALVSQHADRLAQTDVIKSMQAWAIANIDLPAAEVAADVRRRLVLSLAEKYMTTSTAVDPALVLADAQKDAARLKAAIDEVLKLL